MLNVRELIISQFRKFVKDIVGLAIRDIGKLKDINNGFEWCMGCNAWIDVNDFLVSRCLFMAGVTFMCNYQLYFMPLYSLLCVRIVKIDCFTFYVVGVKLFYLCKIETYSHLSSLRISLFSEAVIKLGKRLKSRLHCLLNV